MSTVFGSCALCQRSAELRLSHILPAFAFRWLRERSGTGHIRHSDNINRRVQDGLKKPWMCDTCEGILSRHEQAFSSRLFYPWLRGARQVEYEEWLQRFCTSVSWRVLKHCKGLNPKTIYSTKQDRAATAAEQVWRDYLLGRRNNIAKFEQHLLPLDIIENNGICGIPNNINRYLTGPIEMDIIGSSNMLISYAKLGRFVILGMLCKGRGPWEGSRVHGQHGYLTPRKYILPIALMEFFFDRARLVSEAYDKMSQAQRDKVNSAAWANMERMQNSDHLRAILADADMFGEAAITRKT